MSEMPFVVAGHGRPGLPDARGRRPAGRTSRRRCRSPEPGVPQIMTLEGRYVRAAYNDEGYADPRLPGRQPSVGEPWMLLEVGLAAARRRARLRPDPRGDLARDPRRQDDPAAVRRSVPRGEPRGAPERGRRHSATRWTTSRRTRTRRARSSSSPTSTSAPGPGTRSSSATTRACLGRLFFEVPGGITYGQYWLNVKFAKSLVRVPFRILTKEENKPLEKHFDEHQEAGRRGLQAEADRAGGEVTMGRSLARAALVPALLLLGLWPGAALVSGARAQGVAPGTPSKSVRGKLELRRPASSTGSS